MTERMRFGASRGWFPNQNPEGAIADTLLSGSNVIPTGTGRLAAFPGYGSSSGTAGDTMMPVKDTSGAIGSGTIIYSRGDTYWWIGSGSAIVNTTLLGAASSSLQFKIGLAGTTITAGIPTPTQPVLALDGVGSMTGTFSAKIAYKRSATGAIGNASVASASVSTSGNALKLTGGTIPTGIDRVRVYVPARGFSTTGPWLFLSEHPVTAGSALNITATPPNGLGPNGNGQWADGDRGSELAPINNFSPAELGATGTHFLVLGSVGVIIQGTGGYFWSFPTKLETYSPERFATLPGPVQGVTARAADGFAFVWGTNYLAALILTPDGDVIPRLIWGHVGFPNPDAATLVESELYAWQGEPVRTTQSGDPDTTFALPVREYMRANWNASTTVVGYSPEWNAVVYFNGSEAVAYFRAMDAWSTPLTGLASARAAVTVGVELRCAGSGGTLSRFGSGSGTSWSGVSVFDAGAAKGFPMEVREIYTTCNGPVTVDVLTDLDQSTSIFNMAITGLGDHYSGWGHLFTPNVHSVAIKWSGSGAQVVYDTVVEYLLNRVRL